MNHLYEQIAKGIDDWRADNYPCSEYSTIGEIIDWAAFPQEGQTRFLRRPQLKALETYWYLRLIEDTPHIFDLYKKTFPPTTDTANLLEALGIPETAFKAVNYQVDNLWERINTDDNFVRDFRLQALRETLTLQYPSYILALAMGAGKTVLIGAIIATEFAMASEYSDGPFVQNALVFAPGKTIIESLRELAEIPYEEILPPRFYKTFAASVKLTFTRDGEKDVPVIRRSTFNIVVTNTEKIRIQKETVRKSDLGGLYAFGGDEEARSEVANLRLQAIASLPHLAVFSDEAHHTYGQSLDTELKKVRKTVDYLAATTNVICVVNTTGTPYFQRQPLKDVVIWYGLSEGIKDGILKDLGGNVQAYDFSGDAKTYVRHIIKDFFQEYGSVRLADGAQAKLAIYFPQTNDLKELRPVIDQELTRIGLSPTQCLVNTSDNTLTKTADIDAFNRLNDPSSPHRVILLVNKGTEGWNCPSLFACALARKLRTSNNFVLQAATRCLRQVPGNDRKARVYLSSDNFGILDRQLQETYGERIEDLNRVVHETCRSKIVLKKLNLPPLVVTQLMRTVVKKEGHASPLQLRRPKKEKTASLKKQVYTVAEQEATFSVLRQIGDTLTIDMQLEDNDVYTTAIELSSQYRLDLWQVYDELKQLYGGEDIPNTHIPELRRQIEKQTRKYEVKEEKVDVALALVKPDGFNRELDGEGTEIYTAEIMYPKDKEALLVKWENWNDKAGRFGFHYDPYNFDSNPERSFFEQLLMHLNVGANEVEDVYFTGALTDPNKTDFYVEYKDDKGKWQRYFPDFVLRRKDGKFMVVEIKDARFEVEVNEDLHREEKGMAILSIEGRKAIALKKWEKLNPKRLKYQIIFTSTSTVTADQMAETRAFAGESEKKA